ncbi:hypothetical protein CR513_57076, partial [Mucuna pruriens]
MSGKHSMNGVAERQNQTLKDMMRKRRHAIPNDYIVFLQEYEDDIGLIKDDPINFCQAMQSSNSQKWIDAMKDELKYMQDNDVWDLIELLEGVKPIGCKWIFKTKKDSKGLPHETKRFLMKNFKMKDFGEVSFVLGKVMVLNTPNQKTFFVLPIRREKRRSLEGSKAIWLRKTINQ